ncbi:MAG TPA: hypothetical protein VKH44_09980, partial [Pirellulaceae bacterium]|nr:hypothetical protein [Pirellulaceae bacterium]
MRLVALVVFTAVLVRPLTAESTPAPPDWKDNGTSVYLGTTEKTPLRNDSAPSIPAAAAEPELLTTSRKFDSSVVPSAHVEQAPPVESSGRHLAPPGSRSAGESVIGSMGRVNAEPRQLMDFGMPTKSLYTMGTGLAIVVGA